MTDKIAFVLGYTGATGKALVKELVKNDYFKKVVLVGRRKSDLPAGADDRFVQETVDYEKIAEYGHVFKDCTVGYCCLGCTDVTAKDDLTRIDRDYVINTATVAKDTGCRHFHLVSSVNSDKNSGMHYRRVKGEAEGLIQLDFPKLNIYRPGFLRTTREGGRYAMDVIYKCLCYPWLFCFSKKTKSIRVEGVAKAMLYKTLNPSSNAVDVLENADMSELDQ